MFRRRLRSVRVSAWGAAVRASVFISPDRIFKNSTNIQTQLVEKLRADDTFRDADRSLELGNPEIRVLIDRTKAADLGVEAGDVAQAFNILSAGQRVSTFAEGSDQYDVVVQADEPFRRTRDNLQYFTVASANGGTVGLEKFVQSRRRLESGFDQPSESPAPGDDFRESAAELFGIRRARRHRAPRRIA